MPVSSLWIESQLQQAWSTLFPGRAVSLDDDFFMLAGEGSAGLLALHARSGMESRLEREIPLPLLVEYPTIRELAAFLAETRDLEWPLIVKLEEGSPDGHFFLFPPMDGNSIWYRPLAAELGTCRTTWGLEIPGLDKRQRPIFSMRELASRFVGEIRSIQAKGPYFLGGYSFGGLLAFEAAIQLEAEGEEIAILAMLDRSCPIAGTTVMGGMICPSALIPGHLPLTGKIDAHWNWTTRWVKTQVRLAKGGKRWKENARVPDTRKIMKAAVLQMMAFYSPKSRLKGKMVLLRQEGTGPMNRKLDETYGWKDHVESGIDIRFIPGPHAEVLDGRNTGIVASQLRPYLERERDSRR
jgi:aspartate racemase